MMISRVLSRAAAAAFFLGPAIASAQWQHAPSPTPTGSAILYGVDAAAEDDIWAVGMSRDFFGQFSYDQLSLTLHWDGNQWTHIPSPSPGVYAQGGTDVVLYDVAAIAGDDVWAVGTWYTVHPSDGFAGFQSLALHWDGIEWSQVPTPLTPAGGTGASLVDLEVVAPDDIWAAGYRVAPENPAVSTVGLVLHWDGVEWTELPTPPLVSIRHHRLRGITALASDDVRAVGGHSGDSYGAADEPYVVRWDGEAWSLVTDVPAPGVQTYLRRSAAAGPDRLWVIGDINNGDGTTRPLLYSWGTDGWTEATADYPQPGADLRDIVVAADGTAWAVGTWLADPAPAVARPLVLHWDGSTWHQQPTDQAGPELGSFFGAGLTPFETVWAVGLSAGDLSHIQRLPAADLLFADDFEAGLGNWSAMIF